GSLDLHVELTPERAVEVDLDEVRRTVEIVGEEPDEALRGVCPLDRILPVVRERDGLVLDLLDLLELERQLDAEVRLLRDRRPAPGGATAAGATAAGATAAGATAAGATAGWMRAAATRRPTTRRATPARRAARTSRSTTRRATTAGRTTAGRTTAGRTTAGRTTAGRTTARCGGSGQGGVDDDGLAA